MNQRWPRYLLTLELHPPPIRPGDPPPPSAERRLAAALKSLWRRHGLRCLSAEEVLPGAAGGAAGGGPAGRTG